MAKSIIFISSLVFQFLFLFIDSVIANDCEILKVFFYDRKQEEIVTDWHAGIPYKRYQSVIYPCAQLTIRDNSKSISSTDKDIEVTALFTNKSTIVKKLWCDRKRLEDGDIYSCIVCFESDFPISNVTCSFNF